MSCTAFLTVNYKRGSFHNLKSYVGRILRYDRASLSNNNSFLRQYQLPAIVQNGVALCDTHNMLSNVEGELIVNNFSISGHMYLRANLNRKFQRFQCYVSQR